MTDRCIVAIDVGSGLTKGTDGESRELIPSVVIKGRLDGRYGLDKARPVSWRHGETWLVGEDAIAFGDTRDYADTLSKDWAMSEGWRALLYAMLGRLGVAGKVHLVTGVPMAWYQDIATPLQNQMSGPHQFRYGEREVAVELDVQVVPQAIGALYYHSGKIDQLPNKLAVIDVGTYTSGFSVVYRQRPVVNQCGGIAVGTSVLAHELAEYLRREHNFSTDILTYHEILQSGNIDVRGQKKSVKPVLRELALMTSKPLLDKLQEIWPNRDEMSVFVGGGGADLFLPAIKHVIPHAQRMDGGVFAVVEGMYLLTALRNG